MTDTGSSHRSVARSAGIVSAAIFLSRVTGLVREMLMARLFGAGAVYDAFVLGFRIPNLTRDLFAEGALSSAFVPVFTQTLSARGKEAAARLSNLVATAIVVFVGAVCGLGAIFTPELVDLLAPGFREVPGKYELAVTLTRVMFPFLLLVSLAAQAMGILNACDQFGVPALSSSFFNIGSVAFGLALGYLAGPAVGVSPIEGMAWGVVIGGALQLAVQIPSLVRRGFVFRPQVDLRDAGFVRILKLMGPAILGGAAVQINVMVNTSFASQITDEAGRVINGPVSWLGYAFRFMQLPLGLFGVAIASATLPAISRSAGEGRMDDFRQTMARSLAMVLLLTIPSAVGLAVLGESIIGAIYGGGQFGPDDTRQTALALSCYAGGLAGYAALKVLAPAFYALHDSRTPMYVSLASIGINYAVAATLVRTARLGHVGLALSTAAVAVFGAVVLFGILRRRMGGIHGRALVWSVSRIAFAAGVMGVVAAVSSRTLAAWLGPAGKARQFADIGISIPLSVVAFYLVCRWWRLPELEPLRDAVAGPLARRLGWARRSA